MLFWMSCWRWIRLNELIRFFFIHIRFFLIHTKKQLKCVRFCCFYYYSFMVLWSLSRNRTLKAVVAKPYGKCLVSHSHQTVNQWEKTLRLLTSLNCLNHLAPITTQSMVFVALTWLVSFSIVLITNLYLSLWRLNWWSYVALQQQLILTFKFSCCYSMKCCHRNCKHVIKFKIFFKFVLFLWMNPEAKGHHNGRCRKPLATAPPLALCLYYNYLITLGVLTFMGT